MRILHVGDLHYTLPQLDWVVRVAPSFDLVVLAGDCLDISSPLALDAQTVVILRYLQLLQSTGRVVIGSGNHDLTGPDAHGEQCALWLAQVRAAGVPTDGDSLDFGNTRVTVFPWWDGPIGRQATEQLMETEARRRPARWVWVYHWPPVGSPTSWTGSRHYGDTDLPAWLQRFEPDIVLTGHVHQSPFKPAGHWADRIGRSWVFNAGRQIGPVPAHVVLDLAAGTAAWYSLMGSETLALDAAAAPVRSVF